ncbi:MAG: hypothetical protein J6T51_06395 [Kiritimatiellae bacterium]|nr:hypothetical protein [Kiritimatiellia bacterium]
MKPSTIHVFAAALACAAPASALTVDYDGRTPQSLREWADAGYVREQMEVLGARICKALYGDEERSRLHEDFRITLYLCPAKGGNPAFASGRRITWKVGESPGGDGCGGMGLLCHEMTHVLDMGSDGVFTEAMADWVRNYKVWYNRCTSPGDILAKRYRALRGARNYGKYMSGANFVDFMTQNYGEGTIYRILQGYRQHGKKDVWEKTFGKDFDALLAEWRQMETIYDPSFQWTYNGTAAGVVRNDGKSCALRHVSAEGAPDNSGAWLDGATEGRAADAKDGSITIALHGRFPKRDGVAIASLGTAKEGGGKAILVASTSRADALAAHVVASVPGKGCQVVSTTPVPVPRSASPVPHSLILTARNGDAAAVVVDGRPAAKIDMKPGCEGCTLPPAFAVGGVAGGIGVSGFSEPRGEGGVLLDDVRVFTRTFRPKETAQYAATFGPDYRGGVAALATWRGEPGGCDVANPENWTCFNSYGERILAVPSKETEVRVWFRNIPSVPPKSKFACKSFTIDGLAVADRANIDLRGVRIVDLSDNTRLVTTNRHFIAANAIRANRIRLDGVLAVTGGLKATGGVEMKSGSTLRLPNDPSMAYAKSISVRGEGPVAIRPNTMPRPGGFCKLMRLEEMPEDLARFRLNPSNGPGDAVFKPAAGGKFLGATPKKTH